MRATGYNFRFLFWSTVYSVARALSDTWGELGLRPPAHFSIKIIYVKIKPLTTLYILQTWFACISILYVRVLFQLFTCGWTLAATGLRLHHAVSYIKTWNFTNLHLKIQKWCNKNYTKSYTIHWKPVHFDSSTRNYPNLRQ